MARASGTGQWQWHLRAGSAKKKKKSLNFFFFFHFFFHFSVVVSPFAHRYARKHPTPYTTMSTLPAYGGGSGGGGEVQRELSTDEHLQLVFLFYCRFGRTSGSGDVAETLDSFSLCVAPTRGSARARRICTAAAATLSLPPAFLPSQCQVYARVPRPAGQGAQPARCVFSLLRGSSRHAATP